MGNLDTWQPGVQVGISRDDGPVTTLAGVREALRAVGLPDEEEAIEAVDPSVGVWMVNISTDDWERLEDEGFVEWNAGAVHIEAEMP